MSKAIYRLDIGLYSYIGSAQNLRQRINKHKRELQNGIHSNIHMQNVYNKYKTLGFVVLEELSEEEDQFEIEQTYLDCLDFKDKYTLNKSFVARGMNSEMARSLAVKHRETFLRNLSSKESIARRNQTARTQRCRKHMSNAIKAKLKNDPVYREKARAARVIGGRVSALLRCGYANVYPKEAEYRTHLSETFVEYYKAFGLKKN